MADTNVVLSIVAQDNASQEIDKIAKTTARLTGFTANLIDKLKEEEMLRTKGVQAVQLYKAEISGATDEQLNEIRAMQQAINALDAEEAAQKQAAQAKAQFEAETRQAQQAVNKLTQQLDLERISIEQGKDAALLYKAAMSGATLDQLAHIKSTQNAISAKKQEQAAVAAAEQAYKQSQVTLQKNKEAVDRIIQSAKMSAIAYRDGASGLQIYQARMAGATDAQIRAIQRFQALNGSVEQTGRSMRWATGMAGQMGHQIQDVAVQLQMGTSAGLVFTQQGAQIASLMGSRGPIIGAFLAVIGAIGTYIMASKNAAKETKTLRNELDAAGEAMRNFILADMSAGQVKLKREIERTNREMKLQAAQIRAVINEFGDNEGNLESYRKNLEELGRRHAMLTDEYEANARALDPNIQKTEEHKKQVESLIASLQEEANTLGFTARQKAIYTLATNEATWADYERVMALYDKIEAYEIEQERLKELAKGNKTAKASADDFKLSTDATTKAMEGLSNGIVDAITNANNFADAFRSMAKSIIDDMLKMYLQAQITGFLGALASNFATAQTYGTNFGSEQTRMLAAQDAGLTFPGKAVGGPVTGGKTYLVGERGPELFTPPNNGHIVPNDKIGGQTINVNQTIQISTGVAQTVRAEVMNMMPQIANAAKGAVADARMRGGAYSKALVGG